ncbi:tyrosine-type recombinase/integrase [Clostridium tertium]|uniref:Tyrosine-type recombinase/integrase n=1 Tax=Clostridium tertium TaxID=1559 RepID=A0A9X3XJQ3_9CLOT|nr:tyrosine-type recombinase/integrase [Clostridium tertium]MDC4240910.1 tyrosine-type recombinase/integrase [Clostridium tertium]
MNQFPDIKEYIEYIERFFSVENVKERKQYISTYNKIISKFSTVEKFIESMINKEGWNKYSRRIAIFLTLKCKMFVFEFIDAVKIVNAKEKVIYCEVVDKRFREICEEEFKNNKNMKRDFYKFLLKTFAYFNIKNINEIDLKRLSELNTDSFTTAIQRRRQYILFLDKVMALYNLKGNEIDIRQEIRYNADVRKYGTSKEYIICAINKYIQEEYISKNYIGDKFLKNISLFFKWLYNKYENIESLSDIREDYIIQYYEYVKSLSIGNETRWNRCNYVLKFFIWSEYKKLTSLNVIKIGHGLKNRREYIEDNPKMFQDRKHFNQVLAKVQKYEPIDDEEFLFKNYILVLMGTGLRVGEGIWLDNKCLKERVKVSGESNNEVGEILLRTKDKTKMVNKRTGILPWGLTALDELVERFNSRENVLIYNKDLGEYNYSLFEYKGKTISLPKLLAFYKNTILDGIEFKDENGKNIDYNNIKFHAFRHQKFNDIYEVTNGNIMRVKQDSNHRSIRMAKKYTRQSKKKMIRRISKSIENGKIVGKGAQILQELLNIDMLPEQYLEIMKKLNIAEGYSIEHIVENFKFLGFGYCTCKCKWSHLCEGCRYFITEGEFLPELQTRYSINFMITMTLIKNNGIEGKGVRKNLISLKNQEKILEELGMDYKEIKELRTGEGVLNSGVK